jgi:hypothetical protein
LPRKKDLQPKSEVSRPNVTRRWKDAQPKPEALKSFAPRRWFVQCLATLLVVAAFLAGLIMVGQWAHERIRGTSRYAVPFADIACTPPPGMARAEFLDEVQYLSRLPAQLGFLDDDLSRNLAAAFADHPWVEKVDGVILQPPRQIQVRLVMRRPVLAVRTPEGLGAVDRQGVRLPRTAATEGLPVFAGEARPPQGPAGTKWGDPAVEERARSMKNN